jgi:hypothetical protein
MEDTILENTNFIKNSLDLNLFFLRIMKEHSFFLAVGFPGKNQDLIEEALAFNLLFSNLLKKAIELSVGVVQIGNDAVTTNTLVAEEKTELLTGVKIDTAITKSELNAFKPASNIDPNLVEKVRLVNQNAMSATRNLIRYKTRVLNEILKCTLYNTNYPLLIEHIRREAILFVDLLNKLQNNAEPTNLLEDAINQEAFWNRIMGEHSEFIRGYLDPTEVALFNAADNFANRYEELNNRLEANNSVQGLNSLSNDALVLTKQIQEFKTAGTVGIIDCKIRSLILPLLGDHTVREANHYLKLLETFKQL